MTLPPGGAAALPLILDRTERESASVLSLYLKPATGALPPFRAGQHLPLRLEIAGRPLATYTLSSDPAERAHYRISVKLDPAGRGGSRHLHALAPGATLVAEAPRGRFVLDDDARPVLLLTGGIGITPALAMAHALARQPGRPVYFLHASRSRDDLCFTRDLQALAARSPQMTVFTALTKGQADDLAQGRCQHLGQIDRATLRRVLPLDSYRVYLCGPGPFMLAMRAALVSLGIPDQDIRQETFGGPQPPASRPGPDSAPGHGITFARSGRTLPWTGRHANLLEFVEAQGLSPDFSCRAGLCGSCACRRIAGESRYLEEPLDPPEAGKILLCCSVPEGPLTLDL